LALFEAFVPVASLPPSAVILAPWSLCLVGVSLPYCCSREKKKALFYKPEGHGFDPPISSFDFFKLI
jgi:hypothetical protein